MTVSRPADHLALVPSTDTGPAIHLDKFHAYYGENCIVSDVSLKIPACGVTCLIGPSGAGKSTILRSLNRINDETEGASIAGTVNILGRDLISGYPDITELRRKVGMVFQQPCVFPRSIFENVLFGRRGEKLSKDSARQIVEDSLKAAALWDEVSRRLDDSAKTLSLGQQQRLCIARTLAMEPKILLLDEPTASVDPVSARAIEDLIMTLGERISVVMVTHNIRQAKRVSDQVVFLCDGRLVECASKSEMFSMRGSEKTRMYITEEFCDC